MTSLPLWIKRRCAKSENLPTQKSNSIRTSWQRGTEFRLILLNFKRPGTEFSICGTRSSDDICSRNVAWRPLAVRPVCVCRGECSRRRWSSVRCSAVPARLPSAAELPRSDFAGSPRSTVLAGSVPPAGSELWSLCSTNKPSRRRYLQLLLLLLLLLLLFWPSVDIFPREFKNWDIQNWVQIYQSVHWGVGKLSYNKTALKRCTSTIIILYYAR